MSAALAAFAAHCRRMASAQPGDRVEVSHGGRRTTVAMQAITERERALWLRLAAEAEAFIAQERDDDLGDRTPTADDVPML